MSCILYKSQQQNVLWLLPYVEEHFRRQYLLEMEAEIEKGLQKLAEVLEKKSYFVVSSSLNHKSVSYTHLGLTPGLLWKL